jgi:hypothetical protein
LILPTIGVYYYSWNQVNYLYDNALRSSVINNDVIINSSRPFVFFEGNNYNGQLLTKHTMISSAANTLSGNSFTSFLIDTDYTWLQLSLGLVSLLRSVQWSVYPYLEYSFSSQYPIADRFYTIDGHGRNRDYDIQIQVKKPTVRGTVAGDFTVIF